MSRLKIVNLGLPKSGTTTLGEALKSAGLTVADHRVRRDEIADMRYAGFVGQQVYAGYFETGAPFSRLWMYDALSEISALRGAQSLWPQCDYTLVKAMRDQHPDVKYVVTWRPAATISDSMQRWGNLGSKRLPNATVPGLPHGFGSDQTERIRWIEGVHTMLRDVFAGRDNFLELDMAASDAHARLQAFLGRNLPWWGRANVNTSKPATPSAGS